MANINIGNKSEQDLALLLSSSGYWVHNFARGKGGSQPCDVIAIKGYDDDKGFREWLLDAKHSTVKTFNFSRIEANQLTCFKLAWENCRIECGFAIEYDSEWYYLRYVLVKRKLARNIKSVDIAMLPKIEKFL